MLLFITSHITDALSDLSPTVVQVLVEPWVENGTIRFFTENRYTPSRYIVLQNYVDELSVQSKERGGIQSCGHG